MAYASRTGALYVSSNWWKIVGERGEEHDLMNLMLGLVEGGGFFSRIWWIVGTAVYQFALCVMKSLQN